MSFELTIVLIIAIFLVLFVALVKVFRTDLRNTAILCAICILVFVSCYILIRFSMEPVIQAGVSAF